MAARPGKLSGTRRPAIPGRRSDGVPRFEVLSSSSDPISDLADRIGERLRGLLREVVSDAALDRPVRIRPRELGGVGAGFRMGRAVGITLERDRGHRDRGCFREPLLQV